MTKLYCFPQLLVGKKKKIKVSPKAVDDSKDNCNDNGTLQVKLTNINPSNEKSVKETSFDLLVGTQRGLIPCNVEVVRDTSLVVAEAAYEGGDEHDDILSMRREFSDFDLQEKANKGEDLASIEPNMNDSSLETKADRCEADSMIQNGHLSDPGIEQANEFWGSPRLPLKRSCSNIETRVADRIPLSPSKSQSYNDLQNLSGTTRFEVSHAIHSSPLSVMTPCSADRVMLKKRSSSQVLPSRSRKLWWKLFLWSHRNLHKPWTSRSLMKDFTIDSSNKKGGYTSDTLEPSHVSPTRSKEEKGKYKSSSRTDFWPHNQWVAFSAESSSLGRVDAWVNNLDDDLINPIIDEDGDLRTELPIIFPASPEAGESSAKIQSQTSRCPAEEVLQANIIIQSLNSLSAVAHISGMGLKVVPVISAFASLRSVNLSGNFIVHINPGSLPKSLHTLDLSRNKIVTIEGLRELTRLRVLNLSYNRISRIGQGLSNCTVIKELYLAGNKISNVEGLHRLLKLSVLDLSFNKITTAKALGQLVANYHSLLALNLLGNPIQTNIGDDHIRKAVSGLLPHLTYLNKQPIKPHRAREAAADSVAKAALGDGGSNFRRRAVKRASQGSGSSSVMSRVGDMSHRSSKHRSKSRHSPSVRK